MHLIYTSQKNWHIDWLCVLAVKIFFCFCYSPYFNLEVLFHAIALALFGLYLISAFLLALHDSLFHSICIPSQTSIAFNLSSLFNLSYCLWSSRSIFSVFFLLNLPYSLQLNLLSTGLMQALYTWVSEKRSSFTDPRICTFAENQMSLIFYKVYEQSLWWILVYFRDQEIREEKVTFQ